MKYNAMATPDEKIETMRERFEKALNRKVAETRPWHACPKTRENISGSTRQFWPFEALAAFERAPVINTPVNFYERPSDVSEPYPRNIES